MAEQPIAKTLETQAQEQSQAVEQKKKGSGKVWFFIVFGAIIITSLILAFTKVISWVWFMGIAFTTIIIFLIIFLFVILKLGRVSPGEEKILLHSTEVEDFVEDYLKIRKGIQVGEMHTTLPHNIGTPSTPMALTLTYDDLDSKRQQLAVLVRIDKKKIDPSILYRPYDMDNKKWVNEIQKLKEEMADRLSPSIIKSFRTYSPMGVSESEEKIPQEIQEAIDKQKKEAEKV